MNESVKFSKRARVRARRSAVQALYQWHITSSPQSEIISEFLNERKELDKADKEYFVQLVEGAGHYRERLDELLSGTTDRPLDELDPVERSILWISVYELLYQPDVPARVIINESIELAKMFGAEESHKYINSVVDRIARQTRTGETENAVNG